ncbi:MAG: bifunctional oligoribonuclease/PAP phosphatase NrnA [Candidatus Electrothrix aestuarii]|uniref:Bifunctional oligoribonuclease/PAP phosphatase NrnA n=1 Tax=Candidatus Electrothrix aestuarii TaxID=3062594 RepID=A0AAU8LTL5_9BACT|nr:bifunctional oligoribonuclease/PAP phosphatase NrnA [Candidatus Electrothrix aestuarii]
MSKKAAAQAIASVKNFVLATHIRPDGDALGSTFGLAHILMMMGKEVICYLEQPVADVYQFLTPQIPIETDISRVIAFASQCGDDIMGIALDCGDLGRLGENGEELSSIHPFLVIDHHQGNQGFGDLHWIEPHRSSTGEMVYDLADELGIADQLSQQAAQCLYTAIVTDTGSFRYDSTTGHTFAVAGHLIDRGVTPASVCQRLYDNASFGSLHLTQAVLATLQTYLDQQVAVIRVTREMLAQTGTTYEDAEGLINFPRSVKEVRVAVFLKEGEKGTDQISISLRAKGDCNVAKVAAQFSGGGHRNAAGCRMHGKTMDEACALLIPALEQALQENDNK